MRARIPSSVIVGLGALVAIDAGIGFVLIREATRDHSMDMKVPAWEQKLSIADKYVATGLRGRQYRETLLRPVFFKTRKPFVPEPPRRKPPPPKAIGASRPVVDPGITIAGVILEGGVKKAYLLSKNRRNGAWLSQGESISGWQVRSVDRSGAILTQRDRTIEILLYARE